ncbi:hypothetical protein [Saccharopolyspora sp. NPDC002376]
MALKIADGSDRAGSPQPSATIAVLELAGVDSVLLTRFNSDDLPVADVLKN